MTEQTTLVKACLPVQSPTNVPTWAPAGKSRNYYLPGNLGYPAPCVSIYIFSTNTLSFKTKAKGLWSGKSEMSASCQERTKLLF